MSKDVEAMQREAYMGGEGALFFNDVGWAIADYMTGLTPAELKFDKSSWLGIALRTAHKESQFGEESSLITGAFSLQHTLREDLRVKFREPNPGTVVPHVRDNLKQHGCLISEHDASEARSNTVFHMGLDNPETTVEFGTWCAVSVLQALDDYLGLDGEVLNRATIIDMAKIIKSSWFAAAFHNLALGNNGSWGLLGKHLPEYSRKRLNRRPIGPMGGTPVFGISKTQTGGQQPAPKSMLTAEPTPEVVRELRAEMQNTISGSIGCPVARHTLIVDLDIARNAHGKSLESKGRMEVVDIKQGKAKLKLAHTAIDGTLQAWAHYLENYVSHYGEPYCVSGYKIEHIKDKPESGLGTVLLMDSD